MTVTLIGGMIPFATVAGGAAVAVPDNHWAMDHTLGCLTVPAEEVGLAQSRWLPDRIAVNYHGVTLVFHKDRPTRTDDEHQGVIYSRSNALRNEPSALVLIDPTLSA